MEQDWDKQRKAYEAALIKAALELLNHMGSGAVKLPILGSFMSVYVGEPEDIKKLLEE